MDEMFTEEALKAQDGKEVPLRNGNGGPIIGKAVLRYDSEKKVLISEMHIDDPDVVEFLKGPPPSTFGTGGL